MNAMNEEEAKCPKCGRTVRINWGRHAQKWFGTHPSTHFCQYSGKHWAHQPTQAEAVASVLSDDSNWRPPTPEFVEWLYRFLIEPEREKLRREKRKGYMAG